MGRRRSTPGCPLRPRDGFQPTFTKQSLSILAARWKALPVWGRLRVASKVRGAHLQVVETRLLPFRMLMLGWSDDELAVAVMLVTAEMRLPDSYVNSVQILAAVGLHGLSRRYERGSDRTDKSVLRDLFVVAQAWPEAVRSGGNFEIPALDGSGKWLGSVMSLEGKPTLAVRTYIA